MGGNNSTIRNEENDPYLNPNNRDRNLLNSIYASNSSVVPLHSSDHNNQANIKILSEQQKIKKTKAYKNPIRLDRNTIKLEKDAINSNIFYITMTYSSEKSLNANFYFNAEINPITESDVNYIPSEKFQNCVVRSNLEAGDMIKFYNPHVFFDMAYFMKNKVYDNRHSDLIIELIALSQDNDVECIFSTICKIHPDQDGKSYKIKPELQKLKVNNVWFDIQDIFGFTADNNECEICCNARKNTIFLPCKHSYACKDCAIMIRIKGNNCPICRISNFNICLCKKIFLAISDSVVIENIDDK